MSCVCVGEVTGVEVTGVTVIVVGVLLLFAELGEVIGVVAFVTCSVGGGEGV